MKPSLKLLMIIKKLTDQQIVQNPLCGAIQGILPAGEYPHMSIAIAYVRPTGTTAHFHQTFDEIYFVLDGILQLRFHDPARKRTWEEKLGPTELCVIPKGTHHQVLFATPQHRLCAICVPGFNPDDEHRSEVLNGS